MGALQRAIFNSANFSTRAVALSAELATPITPGFEALVFKAAWTPGAGIRGKGSQSK